jgi:predicted O-methyltransferase YrrM
MRGHNATLDYMTRTFVREPAWLHAPREKGHALVPGMAISPYEGHLLRWLVGISGAKHVLEIGTFMGYSTLWMARGLPADGTITSLEFKHEHAALARAHAAASPHAHQVHVVEGAGLDWLKGQKAEARFDFLFLDAVKSEYPDYVSEAMKLLKPRAFIVGDNTILWGALSGEAPDAASDTAIAGIKKFNEMLADAARFESVMLPTPEGLTVARLK